MQLLTNLFMVVFLWGMNLGQGMSYTLAEVLAPLRRTRVILLAVVLNAVVVPLLYWALTVVLPMSQANVIGFLLVGFAAAAPFGIKAAAIERGDVPLGIGLVVLLGALNVIAIPVWSSLLMPAGTTVNALQIAGTLVALVLLPLAVGLFIKARYPGHAEKLASSATRFSNFALVLLVALMLVTNLSSIVALFGSWVILAGIVAMVVSSGLGYLIGGDIRSRRVVSSVTAMRSVGPALAIASAAFAGDQNVIVTVVVLGVVSLLPLVLAAEWGKRSVQVEKAAPGRPAAVT